MVLFACALQLQGIDETKLIMQFNITATFCITIPRSSSVLRVSRKLYFSLRGTVEHLCEVAAASMVLFVKVLQLQDTDETKTKGQARGSVLYFVGSWGA